MMPMSSPGGSTSFPEYMTEAEYRDLSEEISRTIEIVHGHVIKCESPTPQAQPDRPPALRTPWRPRDRRPTRA